MQYGIVTPAHNEAERITDYMQSVIHQNVQPAFMIIVNDHSTDDTGSVARNIASHHDWISVIDRTSRPRHETGSKVASAFLFGLEHVGDENLPWDVIVKMDADLILPPDYFKAVLAVFQKQPSAGICGGICALRHDDQLIPESLTDRYHVRGALKAYRRSCYEQIGGIRPVYGWDTLDELLAAYYGWETVVLTDQVAEHRAATGIRTQPLVLHRMTGDLFYRMGYGPVLSLLASIKRASMKPVLISSVWSYLGYLRSALRKPGQYVTPSQRIFIRKLRYRRMRKKISGNRA
ncbi:MAG: glycosyltransferase family A protein [Cyclonatronaceae bacterium]